MAPPPGFLEQLLAQELLHGHVPGTFANDSYVDRLPKLIQQAAKNNQHRLTAFQYAQLQSLAQNLIDDTAIPMPDHVPGIKGPTTPMWEALLKDKHYTWQHSPWLLSEFYMFHVVLVLSGFYETHVDPFHPTKELELQAPTTWALLQTAVDVAGSETEDRDVVLQRLIKMCLWGNKVDGCYQSVKATVTGVDASLAIEEKYLLVDHSRQVVELLEKARTAKPTEHRRIQWINDNCGTEFLMDLALADFLLTHEWCHDVVMNVKAEPMYISDVIEADAHEHIAAMCKPERSVEIQAVGARLASYVQSGRLSIVPDLFWNEYKFYWEMPTELEARLADKTDLVILKGDLNLRRLLGDRMWPATTPLEVAVPYFPVPFVSFRTLKSNPVVGLCKEQEDALELEDPDWRFNGKRGTIMGVLHKN